MKQGAQGGMQLSSTAMKPAPPAGVPHRHPNDRCIDDTHYASTPCGSSGCLLGDPQGVEGVGMSLCTSVTASRMTDAYGASTRKGCHADVSPTLTLPAT